MQVAVYELVGVTLFEAVLLLQLRVFVGLGGSELVGIVVLNYFYLLSSHASIRLPRLTLNRRIYLVLSVRSIS